MMWPCKGKKPVRMPHVPALSVVLVASRGLQSIAKVMEVLRAQTAAARTEVVVAARPEHVEELEGIAKGALAGISVVGADFSTSARARVAAIEVARADVIAFAEDHAFPRDRDWAARLIEAHRSHHAGVGPTMGNANPDTTFSWATLLCEYGPWLGDETHAEAPALPGHNSSYKRAALMRYGPALADQLEAEWILQRNMRADGETLLLLGDVKVDHVNFSRAADTLGIAFWGGWMFAASRAAGWGPPRRIAYGLAAPLIWALRLKRAVGHHRSYSEAAPPVARVLPALMLVMAANALGEALGHVFGDCGLREQLARREYDRWRHVRTDERTLLGVAD
jgi:hypothetical protein